MPLRYAIADIATEYDRMSVRQLYYQLVARGVIEKTEQAYKRVVDISGQMRLDGSLDYRKIADGHRERRTVLAYNGMADALDHAHRFYRRNYWATQPLHVEVWCEKDALSGVIHPVCASYGVPYIATRGFPSITMRYESARAMMETGKTTIVFYFGDHDASGQQISDNLEADLHHHGARVVVERVALNPDQILAYRLPTRPGKKSDSRHAKFADRYGDAAVELDALPPNMLTDMVRRSIESVIDSDEWSRVQEVERLERNTLRSLATLNLTPGSTYSMTDDAA